MIALPIDPYLPGITDALREVRAVVITAQPGAGKTTRVPPSLLAAGPVIVLQPRRMAARATAARIADERGWTLGEEVGWQIRFERRSSPRTRLLVVTEGILTARLQTDPLLSDFATVVIDEFHERSIHADMALAMSMQAWRARSDLRIVVMSATLEAGPVAAFLDRCPVVDVPGRTYPVALSYEPTARVADVATRQAALGDGDVLCFVPGAADVHRTIDEIQASSGGRRFESLPLYGAMRGEEQDRVLAAPRPGAPRIIVATNIAETSLTVPGVRHVVDTGWHKVARFDAERGIDSLMTERVTRDAAEQRAGRAGREGPGHVIRLWDANQKLRPHREPEIDRVDLSSTILDILAWGGQVATFDWFEAPDPARIAAALALLQRLGAQAGGQLTSLGRRMQRLPLHPRLARMFLEAGGHPALARAVALLSERYELATPAATTSSDLWSTLDRWDGVPAQVKSVARDILRLAPPQAAGRDGGTAATVPMTDREFRRVLLTGYPDRVGRRREMNSPRFKLSSGTGAVLGAKSGVGDAEFIVALQLRANADRARMNRVDSAKWEPHVIVMASAIDADWLSPTASEVEHWFDESAGEVRATLCERYDEVVLRERPAPVDSQVAAALLVEAWTRRGPQPADIRLLRRLAFAGIPIDVRALAATAAFGSRSLADIELSRALDPMVLRRLERDAPDHLMVPSGRAARLDYADDGAVTASVKLQELFGLAETPRIGPRAQPVIITLLAPNGRPVQITQDLRSFWDRTYPEVRRELRGRYPKHPWPEDPWRADPTWKTKRRLP